MSKLAGLIVHVKGSIYKEYVVYKGMVKETILHIRYERTSKPLCWKINM